MTAILITGLPGQLATALKNQLSTKAISHNITCLFTNRTQFDITNFEQCLEHLKNSPLPINYIINCAAYTNVDGAETNQEIAHLVNSIGPKNLSQLADKFNIKLIHISTDYVFPEYSPTNLPYTENDKTDPLNYYGLTKLDGEQNIINNIDNYIIVRSGWLYYQYGKNFFNTINGLAQKKATLNVVADQIGTPTYCGDLSDFIFTIIEKDLKSDNNKLFQNIYNFSNLGQCSWFEFAIEIVRKSGFNCEVLPILSEQYPTVAKRPKFSVLDKSKAINICGYTIPSWQEGLTKCLY